MDGTSNNLKALEEARLRDELARATGKNDLRDIETWRRLYTEPPLTQNKPDTNWSNPWRETITNAVFPRPTPGGVTFIPDIPQPTPDWMMLHSMAELQVAHWQGLAEFRAAALDAANEEIDRLKADVARLVEAAKPKVVTLPTKGELLARAVHVEADSYWTGA